MNIIVLGIICHLVGDYVIQSHWMASEKVHRAFPAIIHGITYTLPFLLITQSIPALLVISITHILIDRYRLAKYVVWLKNQIGPKSHRPSNPWRAVPSGNGLVCDPNTGYPKDTPAWMAVWLMIVCDNTIHIVINSAALLLL